MPTARARCFASRPSAVVSHRLPLEATYLPGDPLRSLLDHNRSSLPCGDHCGRKSSGRRRRCGCPYPVACRQYRTPDAAHTHSTGRSGARSYNPRMVRRALTRTNHSVRATNHRRASPSNVLVRPASRVCTVAIPETHCPVFCRTGRTACRSRWNRADFAPTCRDPSLHPSVLSMRASRLRLRDTDHRAD